MENSTDEMTPEARSAVETWETGRARSNREGHARDTEKILAEARSNLQTSRNKLRTAHLKTLQRLDRDSLMLYNQYPLDHPAIKRFIRKEAELTVRTYNEGMEKLKALCREILDKP